jgi:hypothetical protein
MGMNTRHEMTMVHVLEPTESRAGAGDNGKLDMPIPDRTAFNFWLNRDNALEKYTLKKSCMTLKKTS